MRLILAITLLVTAGALSSAAASYLCLLLKERLIAPPSAAVPGAESPDLAGELFASSTGAVCGLTFFLAGIAFQVFRGAGSTVRLFAEEDCEDAFDGLRQLGLVVLVSSLAGGIAGLLWSVA